MPDSEQSRRSQVTAPSAEPSLRGTDDIELQPVDDQA